jgi:hypothetical protein
LVHSPLTVTKEFRMSNIVSAVAKEDSTAIVSDWDEFYRMLFDLQSTAKIFCDIKRPSNNCGLLLMRNSINCQRALDACARFFEVEDLTFTGDNIDDAALVNVRTSYTDYFLWLDFNLVIPTAAHTRKMICITLRERLLYELFTVWRTGTHPKLEGMECCWGSISAEGYTPIVRWYCERRCLSIELYDGVLRQN